MNTRILPIGAVGYRASSANDPTFHLAPNTCGDTGKTGLYYSDYNLLCMGMALEYQVGIHHCSYFVEQPITLYEGKYSFRDINPGWYFKDGRMQPGVDVVEGENVCYFDAGAIPIYDNADRVHNSQPKDLFGEIFICEGELQGLTLLDVKEMSLADVRIAIC